MTQYICQISQNILSIKQIFVEPRPYDYKSDAKPQSFQY